MLARNLSANGTAATPYYTLVDMNATIDRPAIKEQVRQDGGVIDLFRYDYEELTLDAIDIVSRELRRDGLVN